MAWSEFLFTLRIHSLIVLVCTQKHIYRSGKKWIQFVAIALPIALIGAKTCTFFYCCVTFELIWYLIANYNTNNHFSRFIPRYTYIFHTHGRVLFDMESNWFWSPNVLPLICIRVCICMLNRLWKCCMWNMNKKMNF